MRLCSRKRPTIDLMRMFSDSPGTPGRRQQMPRTTPITFTPAREASYSRSISFSSTSEFIFSQMPRRLAGMREGDLAPDQLGEHACAWSAG